MIITHRTGARSKHAKLYDGPALTNATTDRDIVTLRLVPADSLLQHGWTCVTLTHDEIQELHDLSLEARLSFSRGDTVQYDDGIKVYTGNFIGVKNGRAVITVHGFGELRCPLDHVS